MSVRVVARVRPLLKSERELDIILRTGSSTQAVPSKGDKQSSQDKKLAALRDRDTIIKIPNPKNENEEYSFQFNAVYDADASQQELFDAEGSCHTLLSLEGYGYTDRNGQLLLQSSISSTVLMSLCSPME
jgi:hypothetical protein